MDAHAKIVWICCSLSIAGSLLVIIIYTVSQKLRQMGAQFVLSQAICDLILACALLGSPIFSDLGLHDTKETADGTTTTTWNCNMVGFLAQFSSQASVAWNFMMSIAIYRTVYAATKYQISSYSFAYYHAYVWFSAFVNASILLLLKQYGTTSIGSCWLQNPPFYVFFILPLLVYYCGSSVVLFLVVKRVRKVTTRLSKSSRAEEYAFMVQVIKYIVVFLVMWSVPLGAAFLKMFNVHVPHGVDVVILLCLTLQGFANASVWLTSPKFLKACVDYRKQRRRRSGYQTLTGTDTEPEKYITTTTNVEENAVVNTNVPAAPQI
eukprot:Phypoly_transcript_06027.p1 GENE.Phypoly_transcript_06027~~Phypoly_transcript_06027.p1  ORF type:complete len:321 (+),score=13.28 Phypoly_transcript_06027:641-1603(+)